MSQDTVTTTTLPLMVVCSGASSITVTVTMSGALVQHDVVLPTLLLPRDTRGVVGLATVLQQLPQSQMPFQAFANYAMGHPQVFLFQSWASHWFVYIFCYLLWHMLSIFRFQCGCHFTYGGSTIWFCVTGALQSIPMAAYLHSGDGPCQKCVEWPLPSLLWVGGALCYSMHCPPAVAAMW